jgi:hypothetical protein
MSYPRNAATPPIVAVGAIYLLADGTIQTTGASVRVKTGTGAWGSGSGTLACDSTSGIWTYAPTQAETDAESFVVGVYKASSTSAQVTVATSASATAGYSGVDWSKVTAATTTVNLSGTTISTTQTVASVSGSVGSVTGAVGSVTERVTANTDQWGGVTVTGMPLPTTSYTTPPTAGTIADAVWDEAYSGHTTAGTFGKLMDTLRKANNIIEGTILATPTPTTTVFRISGADYPTGALEHAILWMGSGASENQNSSILTTLNNGDGTVTVTLEEALVTAPSAGDTVLIDPTSHVHAIADIQAGLATAANLLIVSDRVSYSLAVLVGACSDAQTAAETYTLTIGGNTFTVDYTGLDSSGNRSTTTLSKV